MGMFFRIDGNLSNKDMLTSPDKLSVCGSLENSGAFRWNLSKTQKNHIKLI
jgi:hypothetical protein